MFEGGDAHVSQSSAGEGEVSGVEILTGRDRAVSFGQMVKVAVPRELSRSRRWEFETKVWRAAGERLTPITYSHSSCEGLNA